MKALAPSLISLALMACGCAHESVPSNVAPPLCPKPIRDGVLGMTLARRYTVIPGGNQYAWIIEKVDAGSLAEKAGIRDGSAIVSAIRRISDNAIMWGSVGSSEAESIWSFYEFAHAKDSTVEFGFGAYQDNDYQTFMFPVEALKRLYGPIAAETTKTQESQK